MNKKNKDIKLVFSKKKTLVARARKVDSSKRKSDSSHLLLLPNNVLPIDGSYYKVIGSSILRETFSSVSNLTLSWRRPLSVILQMPMIAKKGHYTADLVTFTEEILNGKLHLFV